MQRRPSPLGWLLQQSDSVRSFPPLISLTFVSHQIGSTKYQSVALDSYDEFRDGCVALKPLAGWCKALVHCLERLVSVLSCKIFPAFRCVHEA